MMSVVNGSQSLAPSALLDDEVIHRVGSAHKEAGSGLIAASLALHLVLVPAAELRALEEPFDLTALCFRPANRSGRWQRRAESG